MYGVFFQIETFFSEKCMPPKFSSWIPRALTKFRFLRIVLNLYPCISRHHPYQARVSRDALNVCAVTKVGTVLKRTEEDCYFVSPNVIK